MRGYIVQRVALILFFIIISCAPVYADQGGYVVIPGPIQQNNTQLGVVDTSGADRFVSFWDEPLWIRIDYTIQILIISIVSLKVMPTILGKLQEVYESWKSKSINKYVAENPGSTISHI